MIKIGKIAPDFMCDAVVDGQIKQISLRDFHDTYKLLFFYPLNYPLLSDITKSIAREYGILEEDKGVALRGSFFLDKKNIVQHASVNNLPLGRNIKELLRLINALMYIEKNGEVCPADWHAGQKGFKATPEGLHAYFNTQEA
jgi:peroxiredoxin 2/4